VAGRARCAVKSLQYIQAMYTQGTASSQTRSPSDPYMGKNDDVRVSCTLYSVGYAPSA
jgi:hypothetical protein